MKLPITFSCLLAFLTVFSTELYAQTEFPLTPILNYSNGFTNSSENLLEIGLSIDIETNDSTAQDKGFLKFGVRVPQSKGDKNSAQIDKATNNFNFFIGSEFILKNVAISKNNKTIFWGFEPTIEFGTKEFEFNPDSTKDNIEQVWKNNWAFELKSRLFTSANKGEAWQWGFFGRFRYSSTNKASDAINLKEPNSNLVNELVVEGPSSSRNLTPALGLNVYPGTDLPFSFSPVFYYYWLDEDTNSDFEKERLRLEQWLYFYPLSEDNIGLRIGFGAFQDFYTQSNQDDDNTFGALVNVKMETNILKSIF